jgi:predicted acyl esterase
VALAGLTLALAPAGAEADVAPFGHACTVTKGVRFCPTPDLASRPASFDGTPIDVDVTLPPSGDGPFPTILLLHGLGGTKKSFESTSGDQSYTNWFFAQHGFAVVTPTARGFGASCGRASAAAAGCEHGWTRLGDMRYEVRDVQTLVGLLVDQGIVKPDAVGATGISYGGGFSTMLAFLKDRVRLPDGGYAPWKSPMGTPISLTAAWPRWLWSNGQGIFTRNGRAPWSRRPVGAVAKSYAGFIFAVAFAANVAPPGGDLSTDITLWKQQLDAGKLDASTQPTLDNAFDFHGASGVARAYGGPSPLLMQSGWTDALFPVGQALGAYNAVRKANPGAPVALQVSDSGHGPGVNHPVDVAAFDAQGLAFFEAWLKGTGGAKPSPGHAIAYTMVCPASRRAGGGPFTAPTFTKLARGAFRFGARRKRKLKITSNGASKTLASKMAGAAAPGALCTTLKPDSTSHATLRTASPGVTLLGQPVITGKVVTKGRNGQLAARIWDLGPKSGTQRLITRGVYRLVDNQKGKFTFTLDGNGWKFAKGHRIVVELLGRDAPTYAASPTSFSATLTGVKVTLPVRDKPNRKRRITKP